MFTTEQRKCSDFGFIQALKLDFMRGEKDAEDYAKISDQINCGRTMAYIVADAGRRRKFLSTPELHVLEEFKKETLDNLTTMLYAVQMKRYEKVMQTMRSSMNKVALYDSMHERLAAYYWTASERTLKATHEALEKKKK